jgi:hypothetical protein
MDERHMMLTRHVRAVDDICSEVELLDVVDGSVQLPGS